jgi:hypothetical protein
MLFHYIYLLLALDLRLALVERDKPLDLAHRRQRVRIVPRRVLDLGLVGRDGVVLRVALVGAVCLRGRGAEVGLRDAVGRELRHRRVSGRWDGRGGVTRLQYVDVSVDDFVRVCFGDDDAIYGGGCVGHGGLEIWWRCGGVRVQRSRLLCSGVVLTIVCHGLGSAE